MSPQDSLDYVAAMVECNNSIIATSYGWTYWLKDPSLMNKFNDEELKKIFECFRQTSLALLEISLEKAKKITTREDNKVYIS